MSKIKQSQIDDAIKRNMRVRVVNGRAETLDPLPAGPPLASTPSLREEINAALVAASMDASEPYEVLDLEQPLGSAPTLIVRRRISRQQADYDAESGYTAGAVIAASRQNEWGRTDGDRF